MTINVQYAIPEWAPELYRLILGPAHLLMIPDAVPANGWGPSWTDTDNLGTQTFMIVSSELLAEAPPGSRIMLCASNLCSRTEWSGRHAISFDGAAFTLRDTEQFQAFCPSLLAIYQPGPEPLLAPDGMPIMQNAWMSLAAPDEATAALVGKMPDSFYLSGTQPVGATAFYAGGLYKQIAQGFTANDYFEGSWWMRIQ